MSTTLQQAPSGTWNLDPVHSTFGFAIRHNGISTFRGEFEQVEAKLEDGVLSGAAQVDSVKTPIPQLKEHLLSPDFFNAAEAPAITFRSSDIKLDDAGSVRVDGELAMRGVSRPVSATGTIGQAVGLSGSEVVGLDLETAIDRRDYGIDWQAELPSGGNVLSWDVKLQIHLELVKA